MDVIAEQLVGTYISPYLTPGLLLAAAASIVVLLSGLGGRLVDFVLAVAWAHRPSDRRNPPQKRLLLARHIQKENNCEYAPA